MIILLLIQYFGQMPLQEKHALQCQLQDGGTETEVFLIKVFGPNIELRVKLSYVFNIVPYGIEMNIVLD